MDKCQRCKVVGRIIDVSAKCSDMCTIIGAVHKENDYVPSGLNIGRGDYIEFKLCLDCGQVQGEFPVIIPESDEE